MDRLFQLTTKNLLGGLNLVLVILCAYAAARIVHDLRRPAPALKTTAVAGRTGTPPLSPPRTFNAYRPILDRNLFKSALAVAPAPKAEPDVPEEVEESPLQAKLIATVVTTDQKKSTATIEDLTSRERNIFRLDDTIMNEAKVVRIERKRVVVLRKGKHEKLSLYDEDEAVTPAPVTARTPNIGRNLSLPGGTERNALPRSPRARGASGTMKAVSAFNASGSEFRVMPNFRQGHMKGFRIFAVTPDSGWAKSGLRNGDVIQSINGREVSNVNDISELLAELGKAGPVELGVERSGKQEQIRNEGGS